MTEIIVRLQKEGFHRWDSAPEHRAYLRHSHRHLFYIEVSVEVFEDDREIEFHDLLDFCHDHFPSGDKGGQSCEHMARDLWEKITRRFVGRRISVSVFEDGEVGARVTE